MRGGYRGLRGGEREGKGGGKERRICWGENLKNKNKIHRLKKKNSKHRR